MRDIKRYVPDPSALKALVHPERLKMLGILRLEGPATASGLAARLGLNSGATSYHLRQLARHGFIEEASDLGNRRDKWWRSAHDATTYETSEDESPEAREAGAAYLQSIVSHHAQLLQLAVAQQSRLPVEWVRASTASDASVRLTAEQAQALTDRLNDILLEVQASHPSPGAPAPEGARLFTVQVHTFPHPLLGPDAAEQDKAGGAKTGEGAA